MSDTFEWGTNHSGEEFNVVHGLSGGPGPGPGYVHDPWLYSLNNAVAAPTTSVAALAQSHYDGSTLGYRPIILGPLDTFASTVEHADTLSLNRYRTINHENTASRHLSGVPVYYSAMNPHVADALRAHGYCLPSLQRNYSIPISFPDHEREVKGPAIGHHFPSSGLYETRFAGAPLYYNQAVPSADSDADRSSFAFGEGAQPLAFRLDSVFESVQQRINHWSQGSNTVNTHMLSTSRHLIPNPQKPMGTETFDEAHTELSSSSIAAPHYSINIFPSRPKPRSFCERNRTFKKGRFSEREKAILWQAAMNFASDRGMGNDEIENLFSKKRMPQLRGAWSKIAECLPHRSVASCYHFCTRAFARRRAGSWTDGEIDELCQLVSSYGRKWTEIGDRLNRLACSCRDKWRSIEHKGFESRITELHDFPFNEVDGSRLVEAECIDPINRVFQKPADQDALRRQASEGESRADNDMDDWGSRADSVIPDSPFDLSTLNRCCQDTLRSPPHIDASLFNPQLVASTMLASLALRAWLWIGIWWIPGPAPLIAPEDTTADARMSTLRTVPLLTLVNYAIFVASSVSAFVLLSDARNRNRPVSKRFASLILLHCTGFLICSTIVILLGAPLQLASLLLGSILSSLLIVPELEQSTETKALLQKMHLPSQCGIVLAWISCYVLVLDWDLPWMVWPMPPILGALLGSMTGVVIATLAGKPRLESPKHK